MIKKPMERPTRQKCGTCGKEMPLTDQYWHRNLQQTWGYHLYCKECRNKKRKAYYNKTKIMKRHAEL